jgi:hypothetical protein
MCIAVGNGGRVSPETINTVLQMGKFSADAGHRIRRSGRWGTVTLRIPRRFPVPGDATFRPRLSGRHVGR